MKTIKRTINLSLLKTSIRNLKWFHILFIIFTLGVSIWYFIGINTVPFHPDEGTTFFANDDLEILFTHPTQLFWSPTGEYDRKQEIRLLDAPLRRYVVEIDRHLAGMDSLPVDWDWSKTWAENEDAGALPGARLLWTGRFSVAIFFPFSLALVYILGCRMLNPTCGWIAAVLFAGNALILLHTRRAMAEGVLIFTILLFLWSITLQRKSIWLIGLTAALAFCTKQSAGILVLVGAVALLSNWKQARHPMLQMIARLFAYLIVFGCTVFILNPYMWKHPIESNLAAVEIRRELLENQVAALTEVRPDLALNNLTSRTSALLIQLYFKKPDIADIGNYLEQTAEEEQIYLANPMNQLFRDLPGGAVLFTLTLFGFLIGIVQITRTHADPYMRLSLVWISGVLLFLALSSVVFLPFQRYYLPLVPFVCLWTGFGAGSVLSTVSKRKHPN